MDARVKDDGAFHSFFIGYLRFFFYRNVLYKYYLVYLH